MAVGIIGPFEAAWLGAGGALTMMILAGGSRDREDSLHPARLQLARFRRSETPADVLVVQLPPVPPNTRRTAGRRSTSAALSVLRVTDGVATLRSLRGYGLCAVIEANPRARAAIENRLRNACGVEVGLGWASFPADGVTLESLIAAAADRVPDRRRGDRRQSGSRLRPGRLASRSLDPDGAPIGRAR
jgi:hypothetical protein